MEKKLLRVPVSVGEAVDKLSILRIKSERIIDPDKVENVRRELTLLTAVYLDHVEDPPPEIVTLTEELKRVNEALWDVENDIRDCERAGDFGERFVALARQVYVNNDRRAALKRRINLLLDSALVEEKSYA